MKENEAAPALQSARFGRLYPPVYIQLKRWNSKRCTVSAHNENPPRCTGGPVAIR